MSTENEMEEDLAPNPAGLNWLFPINAAVVNEKSLENRQSEWGEI